MEQGIVGKVIDNYRITKVLGRGGMGVVYMANEIRLDRDVAIKMMDISLASQPDFLKRFQSEAKALAKLQDPHIVGLLTLRETELGLLIVMEYVEGQTLADIIKASGPPPLKTILPIFSQILSAFSHAHQAGIVHRDIKPSNIMVSKDGQVKVTDFGLAKIQRQSASTMTMGTGGTLYYMSPEQVRGIANVDQRGDLYSIGMTLYECLTGAVPFKDTESDFTIREAIVKGKIPPPIENNSAIPKELNRIVMKAIDRDPAKRFQSAAEMKTALEKFEHTLAPSTETLSVAPESGSGRFSPWFAVPIAVAVIAVGVWLWNRSAPDASLSVDAEPAGATVEINGVAVGSAPIRDRPMSEGEVHLRVSKEGYLSRDTVFSLQDPVALTMTLQPAPMAGDAAGDEGTVQAEKMDSSAIAGVHERPADRVQPPPIRSPEELATYLASALKRKTTLESATVMVMPFTYEDTGISSRFSGVFKRIMERRLSERAGWSVVRQAENIDPGRRDVSSAFAEASGASYMLTGTYWMGGDKVRFVTTLRRIPGATRVGDAEVAVGRSLFTTASYNLRPGNFAQAVSDVKTFNTGVPSTSSLKLDVWTNRGRENLLFAEGDRMQVYVRVNKPCFIRLVYHLADGKRALLLDNFQVRESDVGKQYRIPFDFECAAPFGVEFLQAFARTERFDPVETTDIDGYQILSEDLQKFLIAMRGMKMVSSSTLQAEARVVLTTVAR